MIKCVLQQGQCRYNPSQHVANCTRYYFVNQGDEDALKQTVAQVGPISVAIDATRPQFIMYRSGMCFSVHLSHKYIGYCDPLTSVCFQEFTMTQPVLKKSTMQCWLWGMEHWMEKTIGWSKTGETGKLYFRTFSSALVLSNRNLFQLF